MRKYAAIALAAVLVALLSSAAVAFAAQPYGGYHDYSYSYSYDYDYGRGSGQYDSSQGVPGNIYDGLEAPDSSRVPTANSAMPSWYPSNVNSFQRFHTSSGTSRVVDDADILSAAEEKQLAATVNEMRDRLDMDFVVFTDTSTHGLSRAVYAADFYEFNGYGVGDDYNGLVIFICMEQGNRGWWTAACGACRQQITEGNINQVDDAI